MSDGLWQGVAMLFTIGLGFITIGFIAVVLETRRWRPVLWGVASIATGAIFVFLTVVLLMGGTISRVMARDLKPEYPLQSPSLVETVMQRPLWNAELSPPFVEIFLDPPKPDFDSSDPVSGLISGAGPNAIGARIAPVVVFPLQREAALVGGAHVLVEVLENLPPVANLDSTAAVAVEMGIVGVRAAGDHRKPDRDQWVSPLSGQSKQIAGYKASSGFVPHLYLARDDDGKYRDSPLRSWFDSLKSKKGPCCSDADGTALSDVDWESKDGRYRVRIEGQWWDVPDDAVITEPNRAGRTMVWPVVYRGLGQAIRIDIRCFMPGSMT